MTVVYITGDRSMDAMTAFSITATIVNHELTAHPEGLRFVTGNANTGIERAMRYLVPEAFIKVIERETAPEGHVDFDKANVLAAAEADYAVVIHPKPLDSRIAKSVAKIFKDAGKEATFPLDAILNKAPDDASELFPPEEEDVTETKPE
jgi:predicted nucleic acid-binding protein